MNCRYIHRTVSTSFSGPGTRITRSVWRLLYWPCSRIPCGSRFWSMRMRRSPYPAMPPLAEAELDEPALAGEHLVRELAGVLGGHGALDGLDDVGHWPAVVDELLHAVLDLDAGISTGIFQERALVLILKPAPAGYVVDQDRVETGLLALRVCQHFLHAGTVLVSQTAPGFVRIGGDDLHVVLGGVALDTGHLVFGRILLEPGRHPDIGDRPATRLRIARHLVLAELEGGSRPYSHPIARFRNSATSDTEISPASSGGSKQ